MFGCFRKGEANDPDTYVAAITATLAKYPDDVITAVTHPTNGLPIEQEWLPSVKVVHDACERLMAPIKQRKLRQEQIERQIAEREAFEKPRSEKISKGYKDLVNHLKSGFNQGA